MVSQFNFGTAEYGYENAAVLRTNSDCAQRDTGRIAYEQGQDVIGLLDVNQGGVVGVVFVHQPNFGGELAAEFLSAGCIGGFVNEVQASQGQVLT